MATGVHAVGLGIMSGGYAAMAVIVAPPLGISPRLPRECPDRCDFLNICVHLCPSAVRFSES